MKNTLLGLALLVVFACGFLLGRQFPAHHYVSEKPYFVLDTATGRVCDVRQPSVVLEQEKAELRALGEPETKATATETVDPNGLPYCQH